MQLSRRGLLAAGGSFVAQQVLAQGPAPSIKLIVPFAPGGAMDRTARAITPHMGWLLGHTCVVQTITGGNGSHGAAEVARAAPDGLTLLWDASSHIVNPSLLRDLPFDYATAFTPISLLVTIPGMLAVALNSPATSVAGFITLAKARPGQLRVGTQGNATAGHLGLISFARRAGIEVIHVPYQGGADSVRDLGEGKLDAVFTTTASAGTLVDSGRARALAVTSAERVPGRMEVPTLAESGFPGFDLSEWGGLFGPAGMEPDRVLHIYQAIVGALASVPVRAQLAKIGAAPVGSPPAVFARFVNAGRAQMATLVRDTGIHLD